MDYRCIRGKQSAWNYQKKLKKRQNGRNKRRIGGMLERKEKNEVDLNPSNEYRDWLFECEN